MKIISEELDKLILSNIPLSKQLDTRVRHYRITKADLGIERWTTGRKEELLARCKQLGMEATFIESLGGFHVSIDAHTVLMNAEQTKLYLETYGDAARTKTV